MRWRRGTEAADPRPQRRRLRCRCRYRWRKGGCRYRWRSDERRKRRWTVQLLLLLLLVLVLVLVVQVMQAEVVRLVRCWRRGRRAGLWGCGLGLAACRPGRPTAAQGLGFGEPGRHELCGKERTVTPWIVLGQYQWNGSGSFRVRSREDRTARIT